MGTALSSGVLVVRKLFTNYSGQFLGADCLVDVAEIASRRQPVEGLRRRQASQKPPVKGAGGSFIRLSCDDSNFEEHLHVAMMDSEVLVGLRLAPFCCGSRGLLAGVELADWLALNEPSFLSRLKPVSILLAPNPHSTSGRLDSSAADLGSFECL